MKSFHRRLIRRLTVPSAFTSATIDVAGRTFQTPKIYGSMCELDEPWMIDLLARLLPLRPGPFLDVGVNLGQTLLCVRALDPARNYTGVEPNPICVAYADALKKANGLDDCIVVPVGIGAAAAIRRLEFYHGTTTDSSASMIESFRPDQNVTHVILIPVFPYEDLAKMARLPDPAIVKIDVEGGESEILSSMRSLLEQAKPWLIVEILPCYSNANRARIERQDEIQLLMRQASYSAFRLIRRNDGHLDHLAAIAEIGIHGDMNWVDYLFCPKADLGTIAEVLPIRSVAA